LERDPRSIDPNTYLFGPDLGLDSVDAVQLVSALEQRFAVHISDGELARFPLATLAGIAELLRSKGVGD
jgi:acyl carrier protein